MVLKNNFWNVNLQSTKRRFLKTFMYKLRKTKTKKSKLKVLFREISALRTKRGAGKDLFYYIAAVDTVQYFTKLVSMTYFFSHWSIILKAAPWATSPR